MTRTTIRALQVRGRLVTAVGMLVLLAPAFSAAARADVDLVVYAPATTQQAHQARVALDEAINRAAAEANAALTRAIRLNLDDAVQIKLQVASTSAPRRG